MSKREIIGKCHICGDDCTHDALGNDFIEITKNDKTYLICWNCAREIKNEYDSDMGSDE
jgi:hypothetical protein